MKVKSQVALVLAMIVALLATAGGASAQERPVSIGDRVPIDLPDGPEPTVTDAPGKAELTDWTRFTARSTMQGIGGLLAAGKLAGRALSESFSGLGRGKRPQELDRNERFNAFTSQGRSKRYFLIGKEVTHSKSIRVA